MKIIIIMMIVIIAVTFSFKNLLYINPNYESVKEIPYTYELKNDEANYDLLLEHINDLAYHEFTFNKETKIAENKNYMIDYSSFNFDYTGYFNFPITFFNKITHEKEQKHTRVYVIDREPPIFNPTYETLIVDPHKYFNLKEHLDIQDNSGSYRIELKRAVNLQTLEEQFLTVKIIDDSGNATENLIIIQLTQQGDEEIVQSKNPWMLHNEEDPFIQMHTNFEKYHENNAIDHAIQQINDFRALSNLPPVVYDHKATRAAMHRAIEVYEKPSHIRPNNYSFHTILDQYVVDYSHGFEMFFSSGEHATPELFARLRHYDYFVDAILHPTMKSIGIGIHKGTVVLYLFT